MSLLNTPKLKITMSFLKEEAKRNGLKLTASKTPIEGSIAKAVELTGFGKITFGEAAKILWHKRVQYEDQIKAINKQS